MSNPIMKPSSAASSPTTITSSINPKKIGGKISIFSHVKYEHLVAGISGKFPFQYPHQFFLKHLKYIGGVTSTLILHPLDLIKIRFAGE